MKQWWLGFPKLPFKCAACGAVNEIGNVKFEGRFQLRAMTVKPRSKRGGAPSDASPTRSGSATSDSRTRDRTEDAIDVG